MNDPDLWDHDSSTSVAMREMLRAAREVRPTPAERAAVATRLGIGGGVVLAWASSAKAWLAIAFFSGGAGGAYWMLSEPASNEGPARSLSAPPGESSSQRRATLPIKNTLPIKKGSLRKAPESARREKEVSGERNTNLPVNPTILENQAGASRRQAPPPSKASLPAADGDAISQHPANHEVEAPVAPTEAELIIAARRALPDDPALSLRLLRSHGEQFPSGVLSQERAALKVRALRELGRVGASERELRKLRETHPNSPHGVLGAEQ